VQEQAQSHEGAQACPAAGGEPAPPANRNAAGDAEAVPDAGNDERCQPSMPPTEANCATTAATPASANPAISDPSESQNDVGPSVPILPGSEQARTGVTNNSVEGVPEGGRDAPPTERPAPALGDPTNISTGGGKVDELSPPDIAATHTSSTPLVNPAESTTPQQPQSEALDSAIDKPQSEPLAPNSAVPRLHRVDPAPATAHAESTSAPPAVVPEPASTAPTDGTPQAASTGVIAGAPQPNAAEGAVAPGTLSQAGLSAHPVGDNAETTALQGASVSGVPVCDNRSANAANTAPDVNMTPESIGAAQQSTMVEQHRNPSGLPNGMGLDDGPPVASVAVHTGPFQDHEIPASTPATHQQTLESQQRRKIDRLRTQVNQLQTHVEGLLGEWMINGASCTNLFKTPDPLLTSLLTSDEMLMSRKEAEARSARLPPGYALVATPLLREAKAVVAAKQTATAGAKRGRGRPPFICIPQVPMGHINAAIKQVFPQFPHAEEPAPTTTFGPMVGTRGPAGETPAEKKPSKDPSTAVGKERRQLLKEKLNALGASVDRISTQVLGLINQRTAAASTPTTPHMSPFPADPPVSGPGGQPPPSPLSAVTQAQLDAEHAKRIADVVPRQCLTLLRQLMTHKWAFPFNQPVDAEKMGLVDYHTIVKTPMDLGTVRNRIEVAGIDGSPVFQHPDEVAAEVRRTFANAQAYNPPGSDVHVMATTLRELFDAKWNQVVVPRLQEIAASRQQKELRAIERWREKERQRVQEMANAHTRELQRTLEDAEVQLDELKRTATATGGKPMSFERKQRLHLLLRALPASKAAATAQLLSEVHPGIWAAGRTAVDLDALDPFTLRQLERYALATLQEVTAAPEDDAWRAAKKRKTETPTVTPTEDTPRTELEEEVSVF